MLPFLSPSEVALSLPPGTYRIVSAGTGGDYRRIATATGPAATKGSYTATIDPGRELPSSSSGSPADFYASNSGGAGPVVYADAEFGGDSQTLQAGDYDLQGDGGVGDDTISSVKVPAGWKVTLYADSGCSGASVTFTSDSPYVGDDFNDQASSIRVASSS